MIVWLTFDFVLPSCAKIKTMIWRLSLLTGRIGANTSRALSKTAISRISTYKTNDRLIHGLRDMEHAATQALNRKGFNNQFTFCYDWQ
jgi:hypothetical protein